MSLDPACFEQVRPLFKKWALLLLRDVGVRARTRFCELMEDNPGLAARVLARRLNDLVARGFLAKSGAGRGVRYALTTRGRQALPIVLATLEFASARHLPPLEAAVAS